MEISKAKETLDRLEREMFAYNYAMSSINLDATRDTCVISHLISA